MDDQALVAAMLGNDPAGLDEAYRRYADRLFAYSRSVLHDAEAAADVVQDTFLLASQRIGQLRDPDRLRPWLYAIARHECHRVLRARAVVVPSAVPDTAGESPAPEAGLAVEQVREMITAAVASLNEADREVIELAIRHDLSASDVAAVLGVPANHAHALLSRARSQLKRALSALLLARSGAGNCSDLATLLLHWDGRLTSLLRKRIGRHAGTCSICADRQRELLRPESLLPAYAALPFLAVAESLHDRAAASHQSSQPHQSGQPHQWSQPHQSSRPHPSSQPGNTVRSPLRQRGTRGKRAAMLVAAGVVAVLVLGFTVIARATSDTAEPAAVLAASATPLATSLVKPASTGGLAAATPTASSSTTASDSAGSVVGPDRSSGPPQPTVPPDFTVVVESAHVSCQGSSYTLSVTVLASGATLTGARLYWQPVPSSVPPLNPKMTATGQQARIDLSSLQHSKVAWWAQAVSGDGRTAKTVPIRNSTNPCLPIGGITS